MGVCHFPTFRQAMDATRHLVTLKPYAVELIDRTMMDLARQIAMFRPIVERFVKGERSEEHTSELQSLMRISYAVFCLKKKKHTEKDKTHTIKSNTLK